VLNVCLALGKSFGSQGATDMSEYARTLAAQGHHVLVLCPFSEFGDSCQPNLEVVTFGVRINGKLNPLPSTILARRMRHALRPYRRDVDVIHAPAFPEFGLDFRPLLPVPSVLDVRSLPVSSRLAHTVGRSLLRLQRRAFTQTVVIDAALSDLVFGTRLPEVPLGVNLERFQPGTNAVLRTELGLEPEEPLAVYLGAIGRVRNIPVVIEALSRVLRAGVHLKVLFVGGGESSVAELQQKARELGVAGNTLFAGSVPYQKVPLYLQAADFALAYVPFKVQFMHQPPLKTLEYLACGLPVVATATPGNLRFVKDEWNGLVTTDHAGALADAMRRMTGEPLLRHRLARNARQSVREYDYPRIVERFLLPAYRRAISLYGGARR